MIFNKYLNKFSNAVQHKNKENLKTSNSDNATVCSTTAATNSDCINTGTGISKQPDNSRSLEYERAIAASFGVASSPAKKKKTKINVHNNYANTKTCLTTDELAIIIKGGHTKRHTLKESTHNIYSGSTPPLRETKSSLTLNLSTSPAASSGIYSNGGGSSYGSTPTSPQPTSSQSSSSSSESLNSSSAGETPFSSNVSTPSTSLLYSGNPVWPLPRMVNIPFELAVLRVRMWLYPWVFFFFNFI